jgi:hypothetical protein
MPVHTIQSRIDHVRYNSLLEMAKQKGISISLLIRLIIIEYLEDYLNV